MYPKKRQILNTLRICYGTVQLAEQNSSLPMIPGLAKGSLLRDRAVNQIFDSLDLFRLETVDVSDIKICP